MLERVLRWIIRRSTVGFSITRRKWKNAWVVLETFHGLQLARG